MLVTVWLLYNQNNSKVKKGEIGIFGSNNYIFLLYKDLLREILKTENYNKLNNYYADQKMNVWVFVIRVFTNLK